MQEHPMSEPGDKIELVPIDKPTVRRPGVRPQPIKLDKVEPHEPAPESVVNFMHDDRLIDFYTPLAILINFFIFAIGPQEFLRGLSIRAGQFLLYLSIVIIGMQIASWTRSIQLGRPHLFLLKAAAMTVVATLLSGVPGAIFFIIPFSLIIQTAIYIGLLRVLFRLDESETLWCVGWIVTVMIAASIAQLAYSGALMRELHELRNLYRQI
jgi:hypothetical protein